MITLATLPQATAQEVYDQVKTHLLTQGKKSTDSDRCLYRASEFLKCAAGCFIGEGEYKHSFEGKGWEALAQQRLVPVTHKGLIQKLQKVHDILPVDEWEEELRRVAINNDLNP